MRARHTVKMALGLVVIVAGLMVSGVAGAQSDEYANVLTASVNNTTPGDSCNNTGITVSVDEVQPGSSVSFVLHSTPVNLGSAVANDEGVASLTFDLPSGTTLGAHTITATGTNRFGTVDDVDVAIQVVSCAPSPGGNNPGGGNGDLARTGTDLGGPLRVGVLVVAAGAALVLASRKRTARA